MVLRLAFQGRLVPQQSSDSPVKISGDKIPSSEEMPEIPSTWKYQRAARLVQEGTIVTYGIVLPGPNQPDGIRYIRGQDIDDHGRIHVGQLWKTTREIAAKHRRSELMEGDVLLCVIRHLRTAIVPSGDC